ncbi:MAG: hypothetical protein JNK82_10930 [Myxococcaceae bacterium]|nr:hypothetical protein [Myxococcaceae bacterium]
MPNFKKGGVLIGLQVGGAVPGLDRANLAAQAPYSALLTENVQAAAGVGFRLVYNILGHASLGADFTATGWDVFNDRRGGAGFLVGLIAWHPLELFFLQKEERPFGLDFNTHVGLGYGIVGGSVPAAWGMDGITVQWGLAIDYFLTKWFAVEFFAKCNFIKHDKFYYDWDSAHRNPPVSGSYATLNPTGNGTWWHTGIALVLRIGD